MDTLYQNTLEIIRDQQALIQRLRWNPSLNMLNQAGLMEAIRTLPAGRYTVVYCDIDRLKTLNSATGNHFQTNRYLADGLAVRVGELAGQLFGDEFCFILNEASRGDAVQPDAFIARITRQLAGQPLLQSERYALAAAQGCHVSEATLTATFAAQSDVTPGQVLRVIEQLSRDVLSLKAERDAAVRVR
jgi:GGDEF domain-containing protein